MLGAGAPRSADLNLAVQLAMAGALTAGMVLARRGRFQAHARTQTAVLLLNLVAIGRVMAPSLRRQVAPNLPGGWTDLSTAVPFIHAVLGGLAELLGLYVILVAGTRMLPERLRFRNYRLWMRTTFALWWVVVGLGVAVYGLWYVEGSRGATAPAQQTGAAAVTATNFDFTPKQMMVPVGGVVEWAADRGKHRVVAEDGSFQSGDLTAGGAKFRQTFTKAGTYAYYCAYHGDKGGKDMAGTIVVK